MNSVFVDSAISPEELMSEISRLIEQIRPDYAILLNGYMEDNQVFEMENMFPDKYYCKKLLITSPGFYTKRLKEIFNQYGINIKVY
jgi:hypothetical protein